MVRPRVEEAPISAGNESDFVTGHSGLEPLNLLTMTGLCRFIHWLAVHRPSFRFRMDVEEDWPEMAMPVSAMDSGA